MQRKVLSLWVSIMCAYGASAKAANEVGVSDSDLTLKPIIIDGNNNTGATLGIEYTLHGSLWTKTLGTNDAGTASIEPDVAFGAIDIGYKGTGTVTAAKERNPKNFLDLLVDGKVSYSALFGSVAAGLFTKYEADQSFQNKQSAYGLRVTYGNLGVIGKNDFAAIDINYGQIDPIHDTERQAALGTTKLDLYYRWDAELLYMYPITWKQIRAIEFNYRYFHETGAPAAIKAAGISTHELATVRIGLINDMFLAYSNGKLPFDKKTDHIVEIGFSYKLN